jgi:hypothetical protein
MAGGLAGLQDYRDGGDETSYREATRLLTVYSFKRPIAGSSKASWLLARGRSVYTSDFDGVFDAAVGVSVLAVAVGGLPLWLLMVRRTRREQRPRDLACLLAPVVVPVLYLAAGQVTGLVPPAGAGNGPMGLSAYLALLVLGFAAGVLSAAGPALALRRLRPGGPAVGLAARAAGVAAAAMALAGAASIVAAIGLYRWAPPYHQGWQLAVYPPLVLLAVTVAVVSAARGIRAARSPAPA